MGWCRGLARRVEAWIERNCKVWCGVVWFGVAQRGVVCGVAQRASCVV